MKRFLLCMAVVFAFAFTSAAQDTNPQSSNSGSGTQSSSSAKTKKSSKTGSMSSKSGSSASGSRTTTGFIDKSADGYTLKNGRYKNGVKVTGSDDLAPHVGHTVKLTGNWTTPSKEFAETKVDMVSASCKMGGSKTASAGGASMSSGDTSTTASTSGSKSGKK